MSKRKSFILVLAATLVIAFGLTAGAAVSNEWDIALVNFMGVSNADTIQLEGGVVEIGAKDMAEGVDYSEGTSGKSKLITLRATTSIGDKNAAYIRLDTNYKVPEDFDETTDYILPAEYDVHVYGRNPDRGALEKTGAGTFTSIVENGKVSFLFYLHDFKSLNKSYVTVSLNDLVLYHGLKMTEGEMDPSQAETTELLYTGEWNLEWKYSYKSNAKTCHTLKKIQQDDVTYYIKKIEVSPLGIRMEAVKKLGDRQKEVSDIDLEEIHLKDGRVISLDRTSVTGTRGDRWLEGYWDMELIGEALEPENVESITVVGSEIKL